jgi:hypothetical protein
MFNGYPVKRINGVSECVVEELTRPHFYQLGKQEQIDICRNIEQGTISVVPCHRQQGFDFTQVFDKSPLVITVVVDDYSFLANRFTKIHLNIRNKEILNPVLDQISKRLSPEQLPLVIQKDYELWQKANTNNTDIKFSLSWLDQPEIVENFCQQYGLHYSKLWVEDIVADMNLYRPNYAMQ